MQNLFTELNKQYFGGRLRAVKVRRFSKRQRLSGVTTEKLGEYRPKSKTILIQRGLAGQELIHTLLHEMCHIGTVDHGPKFRRALARLRDMGAPLGVHDLSWLKQPARSHLADIEESIDAIALADGATAWKWSQVRRALAADFGKPQSYFDRYPSLRRYWERERRLIAGMEEMRKLRTGDNRRPCLAKTGRE